MDGEVIALVGTVLVALVGAYGSAWVANRKARSDEKRLGSEAVVEERKLFAAELQALRDDNRMLREKEREMGLELAELQARLKILESEFQTKLALFESAHQDLPVPMWLKDMDGVVLSINPAYETVFLLPIGKREADYVGQTDSAVWPKEIAVAFQRNDNRVWITGKTWIGTEMVQGPDGPKLWQVMKYVRYAGSLKLGIAGIAWPVSMDSIPEFQNGHH